MDDEWTHHGKVRAREGDGVMELVVDGLTTQAKYYKPLIYEFFRKEWRGSGPATGSLATRTAFDRPLPWAAGGGEFGVDILMESVPSHIDLEQMRTDLLAVSGTQEVHDLHVWCLTTRQIALSAHAVVAADADRDRILADMCQLLQTKFDIHHLTLQLECANRREREPEHY